MKVEVVHVAKDGARTEQEIKEWSSGEAALKDMQQKDAQQVEPVEEQDDGMRFKCSGCGSYLKPDPGGSDGMKCDACGEWFTLCEKCMPDGSAYSDDAVWLCERCRKD